MARNATDQARDKHGYNKFVILDPELAAGWIEGFSYPLDDLAVSGAVGGGVAPEVWAPSIYVTPIIDASGPTIETYPIEAWDGWVEGYDAAPSQPTTVVSAAADSGWSWSATLNSVNWQYVAIGAGVAAVGLLYVTGIGEIATAGAIGLAAWGASSAAAASTDIADVSAFSSTVSSSSALLGSGVPSVTFSSEGPLNDTSRFDWYAASSSFTPIEIGDFSYIYADDLSNVDWNYGYSYASSYGVEPSYAAYLNNDSFESGADFGGLGVNFYSQGVSASFTFQFPVLLDLDGDGISITQRDTSTVWRDVNGDGTAHRSAWAAAGDGVLVYDRTGTGDVDAPEAYQFTLWDPTADSDMEALANVFDTNGNGALDAGDAQWSSFKVLVTNADGTTTLKTLAELGITAIDLEPDNTMAVLPDGTQVLGSTTFTRANGTTGTAADVVLTADADGYLVQSTTTANGDGTTSIRVKAYDTDGSFVKETLTTTSAVTLDVNGSTVATASSFSANGTLIDRTTVTTSGNGLSKTTQQDINGDGVYDGSQTDVTVLNANGSTTRTVSALGANGTLKGRSVVTTSGNGLVVTTQSDITGDGAFDLTQNDTTVLGVDGETIAADPRWRRSFHCGGALPFLIRERLSLSP